MEIGHCRYRPQRQVGVHSDNHGDAVVLLGCRDLWFADAVGCSLQRAGCSLMLEFGICQLANTFPCPWGTAMEAD